MNGLETVYKFKGIDNLHADLKGNFFYNDKPAKRVYNNGSLSVLVNGSKKSIKVLRKLAYKTMIKKYQLPF